jgi:hypothetical protein
MGHKEAPLKVNAYVDEGVLPLVAALNEFPNIITLSSCEGDGQQKAFVAFAVANADWKETGDFLAYLSSKLREVPGLCDESAFSLSLDWYAGGDTPSAYIRVPRHCVERLAHAIRDLAATAPLPSAGPVCCSTLVAGHA